MMTATRPPPILTRPIICPVCTKGKLMDAPKHIPPWRIHTYTPPMNPNAQGFVKCKICKEQIGISIDQ